MSSQVPKLNNIYNLIILLLGTYTACKLQKHIEFKDK